MISGVNLKSGKICSVMAEKIVSVEKTDSDFGLERMLVTDVNGDRYKVLLLFIIKLVDKFEWWQCKRKYREEQWGK